MKAISWLLLALAAPSPAQTPLLHTTLDDAASVSAPANGTGWNSSFRTTPAADFAVSGGRTGIRLDAPDEYAGFRQTDGTTANINLATGTVEFWYLPNANHTDGVEHYFFRVESQWNGTKIRARKDAKNFLWFEAFDSGNNVNGAVVDPRRYSWTAGTWVRLRFTWDGGAPVNRAHIYINGQEPEYTNTKWAALAMPAPSSTLNIYIGNNGPAGAFAGSGNFPAGGVIDDFKIYGVTLPENAYAPPPPTVVTLPQAAHAVGDTAGFYLDPETGNRVYRLSDATLCPNGGQHFYSYYRFFSIQGDILIGCQTATTTKHYVYDRSYKLLGDVVALSGATGSFRGLFWSAKRRTVLAGQGLKVWELDPFNKKATVWADFSPLKSVFPTAAWISFYSGINGDNGPNDEIVVTLQDSSFNALANVTYDPLTGRIAHAPWPTTGGFPDDMIITHERHILFQIGNDMQVLDLDFNVVSSTKYHAHHGTGFLSDGRGFIPGSGNSPDCPRGLLNHWRPGASLWWEDPIRPMIQQYNCAWPGDTGGDHWALVDVPNVFLTSTGRTSGAIRADRFYEYGIVKGTVTVDASGQASVGWRLLARHRSNYARGCPNDYWYSPRVSGESFTGNRAMFDSDMANSEYPGNEKTPGACGTRIDVFVVEDNQSPTPVPGGDATPPAPPGGLRLR